MKETDKDVTELQTKINFLEGNYNQTDCVCKISDEDKKKIENVIQYLKKKEVLKQNYDVYLDIIKEYLEDKDSSFK